MKAAAFITGLFVLLAGAVCAEAEPASKPPQEGRPKELLGPRQDKFTKDFKTVDFRLDLTRAFH